jgi:hypothetical protein
MLYTRIRFALIGLFIGLGILLHLRTGLANAWYLYAAGALLLLTYLLFGNVWTAFNLLKRGRPEQAQQVLNRIYFPELLAPRHRAYFHFTQGMIQLQAKQLEAAAGHLERAAGIGLSRPVDKALLELNLAHIRYVRREYADARRHLDTAKSYPTDDLLIRENIDKLERALAALQ